MSKIPAAKEFVMKGHLLVEDDEHRDDLVKSHIEFAKLHAKAALKKASENTQAFGNIIYREDSDKYNEIIEGVDCVVNKNSILNAYPLENIK
jgi:hypothetical protein